MAQAQARIPLSRALIGIGTSASYPTAMALVRRRADEYGIGVPGRVLGNFSIAAQVTAVVGLPLGGVPAGAFGWRALFAVNIPLAVLAFSFTLLGVAKDAPVRKQGLGSLLTMLDLPVIALFAGAVISLLVFLSALTTPAWWLADGEEALAHSTAEDLRIWAAPRRLVALANYSSHIRCLTALPGGRFEEAFTRASLPLSCLLKPRSPGQAR